MCECAHNVAHWPGESAHMTRDAIEIVAYSAGRRQARVLDNEPAMPMSNIPLEDVLGMIERLEGDVRSLRQTIERASFESRLPVAPLEDVERAHILDVLRQTHGNRMAAARVLGISRRSLYRRLERHHIDGAERPHGIPAFHE
jgi:transcriptional regulator of acetoin/glycerol metabolism